MSASAWPSLKSFGGICSCSHLFTTQTSKLQILHATSARLSFIFRSITNYSPTAMSSKRQLKRLSLLQTAPFPTTPTTTTTAANGPADTPVDAYVEPYGHSRFTGASTSSSPSYATNSPAGSGANSSSRRQSTINYFSRDEQHSPSSSTSLSNQNYASTSSTSSPRTGSQNAEEDPSTAAPSRERAALTLVEKYVPVAMHPRLFTTT